MEEVFEDALTPLARTAARRTKPKQELKTDGTNAGGDVKSPLAAAATARRGSKGESAQTARKGARGAKKPGEHGGAAKAAVQAEVKSQWAPAAPQDGGESAALEAIEALMAGDLGSVKDDGDAAIAPKADVQAVDDELGEVEVCSGPFEAGGRSVPETGTAKGKVPAREAQGEQGEEEVEEVEEEEEEVEEDDDDDDEDVGYGRGRMYAAEDDDFDPYGEEA